MVHTPLPVSPLTPLSSLSNSHTLINLSLNFHSLLHAITTMPTTLGRNLHLCFTKLKRPLLSTDDDDDEDETPCYSSSLPIINTITTTTTTTTSSPNSSSSTRTATLTPSSVLIKNYNSLYEEDHYESTSKSLSRTSDDLSSSSDDSDALDATAVPDFATVFASKRFFFSSPGRSNSIIESQQPESEPAPESDTPVVGGGVPIPTYSPDPYMDFRRSMQEMVEARELSDVTADWDYLHELLLCYLALNPKHAHKFIIGAFADLLVSLMEAKTGAAGCRKLDIPGKCEVSQQVV